MSGLFSQFRQVASYVDRKSKDLESTLDNPSIDEKRSCLLLKQILSEVKNLQSDFSNESKEVQKKFQGNVLDASTRLTQQISERIYTLETHLQKYGYAKPQEDLPDPCGLPRRLATSAQKDESATVPIEVAEGHENQADVSRSNEDEVGMADEQENSPLHDTNEEEVVSPEEPPVDPWKSPIRPVTFTRMIDATPDQQLCQHRTTAQDTPKCETPEPPPTATPMIRGISMSQDGPDTPEGTYVLAPFPKQPVTTTPMIKVRPIVQDAVDGPNFSSPQLPEAPVMGTPGLQWHTDPHLPQVNVMDDIPMAPQITSVKILQPDDLFEPSKTNTNSPSCEIVSALSDEEYHSLPPYVTSDLSLEKINDLIRQINVLLSKQKTEQNCQLCVQEQELCKELCIPVGAQFKTMMLALSKTGRLAVGGLTGKLTFLRQERP